MKWFLNIIAKAYVSQILSQWNKTGSRLLKENVQNCSLPPPLPPLFASVANLCKICKNDAVNRNLSDLPKTIEYEFINLESNLDFDANLDLSWFDFGILKPNIFEAGKRAMDNVKD